MCTTTIAVSELPVEMDNYCAMNTINDTPSSSCDTSKKNARIVCEYCSKSISKNNISTHLKRCSVKKHESKKSDPTELLNRIDVLTNEIKQKHEETVCLKQELRLANQRAKVVDEKFDKLLSHIVILKPAGVNLDMGNV